ncbi:hypothetical protein Tfer_0414 [Thermincola ferriacetica]|uniref:CNNM transmembrane domain-containing protein n=1 Tax=Thermincola ferriacetica TaxID=281456 RepID=A0A0L6W5C9_9FIRM|nr:hypothetical protein [Thermincola ferriacetica]KNZ70735.1 hypothetical protein Tfer_0414 [Thermincola ferriacetica]
MGDNRATSLKSALIIGIGTFFLASFFSLFSELVLPKIQILLLSFLFLFLIIFLGIIFDIIGIAAAAANERPFHAKAAKKVKGSVQAIKIVRNADRVASFCNDVVGDICGTVSGALGAAIVFQVVLNHPGFNESILSIIMTGLVAALTVSGKALGKKKAIAEADHIVFRVGQALAWMENVMGVDLFSRKSSRKHKDRRR